MNTIATDYTLAELCIVAAAEAFRDDGEVLATGGPPLETMLCADVPVRD